MRYPIASYLEVVTISVPWVRKGGPERVAASLRAVERGGGPASACAPSAAEPGACVLGLRVPLCPHPIAQAARLLSSLLRQ